jgi:hypothetical protein
MIATSEHRAKTHDCRRPAATLTMETRTAWATGSLRLGSGVSDNPIRQCPCRASADSVC